MTDVAETTYPFADPSPQMKLFLGTLLLAIPSAMLAFVCAWRIGGIPLHRIAVPAVLFLVGALAIPVTVQFATKRSRVIVTPGCLILKRWMERQEIAWRDVVSVSLERYEANSFVDQLRGGASVPRVKIILRRRRLLAGFIPTRALAVYLQEPERFVEEAQQHLAPAAG